MNQRRRRPSATILVLTAVGGVVVAIVIVATVLNLISDPDVDANLGDDVFEVGRASLFAREIAEDVFGLRCDQALFIDDVARVAEAARALGAAFIGHPTTYEHSFQRRLMREAGVRHLVGSLDAIDESLLRTVDAEAAAGCP